MNKRACHVAWRFICTHWGEIQCGGLPITRLQRLLLERLESTTPPADELAVPF